MEVVETEEVEELPTVQMNTIAIPNEEQLLLTHNVYRPSKETVMLKSEKERVIFAEIFMENNTLGPLYDLCVRTLAKGFESQPLPIMILADPLKMRVFFDSLSVDLPLDHCFYINDVEYWRRVVRTKSKRHALTKVCDWKNVGLSIKYVELVEDCSAEYWPTEEMQRLALLISDVVTEMHIRKLKPLQMRSFEEFLESEPATDSSEEATASVSTTSSDTLDDVTELTPDDQKTEEELEWERQEAELRAIDKKQKHLDREERRKEMGARRARNEARRVREELKNEPPPPPKKKIKKIKLQDLNIFELPISEDEDDGENDILDRRNLAKTLNRRKKDKLPPEVCHHIDLSFVQWFEHLTSFTIEFLNPDLEREYDDNNLNFSYKDIENLARGLSFTRRLKTFRLRNSRMDARKLETLVGGLQNIDELEIVDFGNDELLDDCGIAILKLFRNKTTIKSLELEGNSIGPDVLKRLASALLQYEGNLEYLGLAANPLGDEALHALTTAIVGTKHVKHLCLTGISISQEGIVCCIANELLREHPVLLRMDLVAINFGWTAGKELLKALATNQTILQMDTRGCYLDPDMQYEVELLLKRNNYIAQNPYLSDDTQTEENILEFVDRVKNPILLDALGAVEQSIACEQIRPDDPLSFAGMPIIPIETEDDDKMTESMEKLIDDQKHRGTIIREQMSYISHNPVEFEPPFVYDTSKFTEDEFLLHLDDPGTPDRYFYIQEDVHTRIENAIEGFASPYLAQVIFCLRNETSRETKNGDTNTRKTTQKHGK